MSKGTVATNNVPSFSLAAARGGGNPFCISAKTSFSYRHTPHVGGFDCRLIGPTGEQLIFFIAIANVMTSIHSNGIHTSCCNGSHRGVFVLRFVVRSQTFVLGYTVSGIARGIDTTHDKSCARSSDFYIGPLLPVQREEPKQTLGLNSLAPGS